MNIPAKVRGWLYILLAVFAVVLAAGIVLFGWVTQDQVMEVVAVAAALYAAFIGLLARLNLSDPKR
jgi:hypothetical protein